MACRFLLRSAPAQDQNEQNEINLYELFHYLVVFFGFHSSTSIICGGIFALPSASTCSTFCKNKCSCCFSFHNSVSYVGSQEPTDFDVKSIIVHLCCPIF